MNSESKNIDKKNIDYNKNHKNHKNKNYDFAAKRMQLIKSLQSKGIKDEKVLKAMAKLPRELFVAPAYFDRAYEDSALPLSDGQTISQPYTVAYMTSLLNVRKGDRILEIGTGSGYQAALLNLMGADVYSIERIAGLQNRAKKIFEMLEMEITLTVGDGTIGWEEFAPYDGIIITAGAPRIPDKLRGQLDINGRMVVPVGNKELQNMYVIIRISEREFSTEKRHKFKFVPLIGKDGWG